MGDKSGVCGKCKVFMLEMISFKYLFNNNVSFMCVCVMSVCAFLHAYDTNLYVKIDLTKQPAKPQKREKPPHCAKNCEASRGCFKTSQPRTILFVLSVLCLVAIRHEDMS